MKRLILISSTLTTLALGATATPQAQNKTGGLSLSGVFESAVSANVADNNANTLSYGAEEYANIRMQSRMGDNATFFGAVNLIAAAGDYAARAEAMGANIDAGENYAAAIELERLYFRLKTEKTNFDGGLMRLPFGYSTIWGPLDFLNPKNPLKPDARPRAVLGGGVSWFPAEELKLQGFAVTGRDPLAGNSGIAGISADKHWEKLSVQTLYSFERSNNFPGTETGPWTHRAGLSLKADLKAGIVMEMLYLHHNDIKHKPDGLRFSAGLDYSLFGSKLIILTEYMHSGQAAAAAAIRSEGGFGGSKNNLYAGLTWRFNDFTNAGAALISGDHTDDALITFNHELFQGVSLNIMAQIPIRRPETEYTHNANDEPEPPAGTLFYLETKLKFRF